MEGKRGEPAMNRNTNVHQEDEERTCLMDDDNVAVVDAEREPPIALWILYAVLYGGLSACVIFGDTLLGLKWIQERRPILALGDNGLHAAIGGLTWALAILPYMGWSVSWTRLTLETIFASLVASIIDLDHFAAAGSIHLRDATSLLHRPPLHGSTFWLILWATLLLLHWHCPTPNSTTTSWTCCCLHHLAWMVFASSSSHHVRDALRRGIWMPPFGSTPPVPYCLYVALLLGLPLALPSLMRISATSPCLPPEHKL